MRREDPVIRVLLYGCHEHLGSDAEFPALRGNRASEAGYVSLSLRAAIAPASQPVKTAIRPGLTALGSEAVTRPARFHRPG
jgi:hypothetical protein